MESSAWRPRLVEQVVLAYAQCWGGAPDAGTLDAPGAELRILALADLALPFEAAGLLNDTTPIAGTTPASIRRAVLALQLNVRFMSVGCQVAAAEPGDLIHFGDEIAREWATWLSYCTRAHSAEFRDALVGLSNTVSAFKSFRSRPRRVVRERGDDGEVLSSIIPEEPSSGSDFDVIEPALDRCAVIASVLDSFRSIDGIFPELIQFAALQRVLRPDEFVSGAPFHPFLWPYSLDSLHQVLEIASGIRELGRMSVSDDEEGDTVSIGSTSRART